MKIIIEQKGYCYAKLMEDGSVDKVYGVGLTEDDARNNCISLYGAAIGGVYPLEEGAYDYLDTPQLVGRRRKLKLKDGLICTACVDRINKAKGVDDYKKLSIILDMTCYDHLKALADDKGVTKSRIIMDLIDKAYAEMVEE